MYIGSLTAVACFIEYIPCSHRGRHEHDDVTTSRRIKSDNSLDMFQIVHFCLFPLAGVCFQFQNKRPPRWDFAVERKTSQK